MALGALATASWVSSGEVDWFCKPTHVVCFICLIMSVYMLIVANVFQLLLVSFSCCVCRAVLVIYEFVRLHVLSRCPPAKDPGSADGVVISTLILIVLVLVLVLVLVMGRGYQETPR